MKHNSPKEDFTNSPAAARAGGKILVTGANGQLGNELKQLTASFPSFDFIFLAREDLQIHHFELVRNFFKLYHPHFCINCAAYTAVDKAEAEKELAFRINGEAVGVLAAVCKEYNCRFIHISTDYVFDGTASIPYKEDSPTNPQSIYGASKLEGEKQAMQFNPDSIIIRTSWVYSEFGKNFVKTMLKMMSEKEEVNVVNDQYGSPTYAADLSDTILQIITKLTRHPELVEGHNSPVTQSLSKGTAHSGLYHYSNEGIITWYDLAIAIKEISGSQCRINPIPTSEYPLPAKRPAYAVLDKTKIQRSFGITLRDWKQSLDICIQRIKKGM